MTSPAAAATAGPSTRAQTRTYSLAPDDVAVAGRRDISSGCTPAADGGWRVAGTLTARGVTSPATLVIRPDTAAGDTAGSTVRATARIDRFAHGITAGRGLASRHLEVVITVTVQR